MILALMFDSKLTYLYITSNYVRIKKITIATRYDFETIIPSLILIYQKVHPFAKHPSNSSPQV